jgi:hypothetical protein
VQAAPQNLAVCGGLMGIWARTRESRRNASECSALTQSNGV